MNRRQKEYTMGAKALAIVLGLGQCLAMVAILSGCGTEGTTGPSGVSGINRDLTPLYLTYDIEAPARGVGQDYGLGERPSIRAIIVAKKDGENGKQDQIRIEEFSYPITWELVGESTLGACGYQNYTFVSAELRCRAPGIHMGQARMTIDGVMITSPQPFALPFQ